MSLLVLFQGATVAAPPQVAQQETPFGWAIPSLTSKQHALNLNTVLTYAAGKLDALADASSLAAQAEVETPFDGDADAASKQARLGIVVQTSRAPRT